MAVRATALERRHGQHSAVFHCSSVERTVTLIIYFIFIVCVICIYLVLGADFFFPPAASVDCQLQRLFSSFKELVD